MRPTSSWVKERSSQYLTYLVIISNSQPRNQFLHIVKKNFKISKQIYIYVYIYIYIYMYIFVQKKGKNGVKKRGSVYADLGFDILHQSNLIYICIFIHIFT